MIQKTNPTDQKFRNPDFPDFQIFGKNHRFSTKFRSRWRFFVISRKSGFWIFSWVENFFRQNFFVVLIFTTKKFFQKKISPPPKISENSIFEQNLKISEFELGEQKGAKSIDLPHFWAWKCCISPSFQPIFNFWTLFQLDSPRWTR